jgi:hypothetical protein
MLLDRNLIVDLIVVEFERENGYRHPPLYIVTLSFRNRSKKRRASRELVENTHVQIELIEESFDSIS